MERITSMKNPLVRAMKSLREGGAASVVLLCYAEARAET